MYSLPRLAIEPGSTALLPALAQFEAVFVSRRAPPERPINFSVAATFRWDPRRHTILD